MCGIAGVFTPIKHVQHAHLVEVILRDLQHRGPDFSAIQKIDDFCSLAHARLKIIDLTDNANQPMYCYRKRYTIVFNGEIYNFKQLKLELQRVEYKSTYQPYSFQTNSDTEVILAAYHRWGENCVNYLDGMFAFAVYDNHLHELFLARDRQGKKPLYYILKNNVFAFASEIRALINSTLSNKKLNTNQLYDYFQYQTTFSPHTFIEDIQLLESATTLKLSIHSNNNDIITEKKKYWKPIYHVLNKSDLSYDEAKKQVRNLLLNAVEKRLVSDVPLGVFLSGGIDSSAIVGIMTNLISSDINTFHVTTQFKEFSENEYAQSFSYTYKTNHHNIVLNEKDVLSLVPEALEKMDYPTGDGINTYIVSKATKHAGITVALSGIGGDELFAGYPQFKIIKQLHHLDMIDLPLIRKILFNLLPQNLFSHAYRLKILMQSDNLKANNLLPFYRQLFLKNNLPFKNTPYNTNLNTLSEEKYLLNNQHILSYISLFEMNNYLQHVLLRDTDQMSMAHALEVRAPFMDAALINFVLSLPDDYKYPSSPKKLLTDAVQDILPKDIVQRKKMGFVLPFKRWMRNELQHFCENKIQNLTQHNFIDSEKLWEEWNRYQKGKHDRWWMFWHLIVLQFWIEKNNIHLQ
ncbi:MAG: asparagine synthase (glutamine-hydrolyzing) [Bacteroidia bacterium]|nr:asparagine synthase (glutamine-hydrolyzing) [Bacteroidia bacterium]